MLFSPRIRLKELAELCRRLAIALESGIDIRRVWTRESQSRLRPALRARLAQMSGEINQGASLTDAVAVTGDYFPPVFRSMVAVGEETGHSAEVFRHMAEYYEQQLKLRRSFLTAIAWPAIELTAAIGIIGLLIWIMGALQTNVDILGFGLVGNRGVVIYFLIVAGIVAACWAAFQAARRGAFWIRLLQELAFRTPGFGPILETMAMARFAWTLHLGLESGLDPLAALPLALDTTHAARYADRKQEIARTIRSGGDITEALRETGVFPANLVESIAVGEHSGRLGETLAIVSRQYQDQAQKALTVLNVLAGFAVWGLVAVMIIAMIFRLLYFYIGQIQAAAEGRF